MGNVAGQNGQPPRIVMLLANEFVHDTRVFKEARSLIEWGCEVHVVATHRAGLPAHETQQEIIIHRVIVPPRSIFAAVPAAAGYVFPSLLKRHLAKETPADGALPKRPWLIKRIWLRIWRGILFVFGSPLVMKGVNFMRRGIRFIRNKLMAPSPMRMVSCNTELAKKALRLKPDVVVAHDLNTLPAAVAVKRALKTPVVYDSHELFLERNIGDKNRNRDKRFWGPVEKFCIKRADAVMTVANGICDHLQNQYKIKRPALVRNVQPYEPPAPRSRLLSDELGIDHDTAIVLYPGAITINRGLEQMIDSSVHLKNAAYVIMGYARNAVFLASLKQRADDLHQLNKTVFFRDAVPIEDVVRYTASADLGIVPTQNVCLSYQFESSNKIFHCLMAGVPVVMSDHSEKRHIAETHNVGLLFDETDPKSIAKAVNDALANRAKYEQMRRNCLTAARELNWEHEQRTLRQVFADVLGDRAMPIPEPVIPECDTTREAIDVEVLPRVRASEVNERTA